MLDTYQLLIFVAVVETGSYTAAARRLHLTQPAVSRQIRLLQERLGVRLFRRVGRRMLPTHAGERLVETARRVTVLAQRAEEEMAVLRGEVVGGLHIGGSGAPAWQALAHLLSPFRAAYPGISFHLEAIPPEGAGRALREGRLDIVVSEERSSERAVAGDLLVGTETVLIAPLDPHWGQRKRLPLRKLPDVPLILPVPGTPARNFIEEVLSERGIALPSPVQTLEVADPGAALPLVAAGLGAALLPHSLLEVTPASLHVIALWPSFTWPLYLVRRSAPASRAEEAFVQFALNKGQSLLR